MVILGAAVATRVISARRLAERENNYIQALYLAEAGIDFALTQLRGGSSNGDPAAVTLQNLGTYDCSWNLIAGETNKWEAVSTGTINNISRTVRIELIPDTFARYIYFTDDEHFRWGWLKTPVWFITGDYLGGPLQTNSHLHISGNPIFEDPNPGEPVKSVDNFITFMNGGSPIDAGTTSNPPLDIPDFRDGIVLGADDAPFPSKALDLRTAAIHDGYHLSASASEPAEIILNSDSTMTVTDQFHTDEIMPLPANGAIFVTGSDVLVSGTLSGQLSIGTNRSIVITDDILYHDDPRVNPESTDVLGLIAERDVIISKNAPYDIEVDASVMALGNSFTVEEWWQGPAKGILTVYGGIIQDFRGPVGTFDPTTSTKLSGYSKNYLYDNRLIVNPPPFYSSTGDYVIISWQEQ